jgi:hypothetical protein
MVSMFDQNTMKEIFDANREAQEKAGMGALPSWIAPFHEEGRGARGIGDGFGEKAIWTEPLNPPPMTHAPPGPWPTSETETRSARALTLAEAKQGLAKTFGVRPEAVKITIEG